MIIERLYRDGGDLTSAKRIRKLTIFFTKNKFYIQHLHI